MQRRPLLWQLFPSYLAISLLLVASLSWYQFSVFRSAVVEKSVQDLESRLSMISPRITRLLGVGELEVISEEIAELGDKTKSHITVLSPEGMVIADSAGLREGTSLNNDQEIAGLGDKEFNSSRRFSEVTSEKMVYAVSKLNHRERGDVGVLRVGLPLSVIFSIPAELMAAALLGVVVITLLAAFVSWYVAKRLSRPLQKMRRGAIRFARGQLDKKMPVTGSAEMASLAESLNRMAGNLNQTIQDVIRQRNELDAVLESMSEGVFACDREMKILNINHAAESLFGVEADTVKNRKLTEVIRNSQLHRFVASVLEGDSQLEGEVRIDRADSSSELQVSGTILRDSEGQIIGALMVMHDVTDLKRLERVRRDFVANVSHELKTPITSIKGFVETLLNGAINNPEDAKRFIEIISRQSDRLSAIIDDLLELSRLEQGESEELRLVEEPLLPVIESAISLCEPTAEERGVSIDLECTDDLSAELNSSLMEQAVVNLIDNAVKYSSEGSSIQVRVENGGGEVVISVSDNGRGIEEKHLPRLFERFYRIDKGRSRSVGGTGLGLAIVKHIAQVHGGRAAVQSTPGKGSTFSIHLAARQR